MEFAAICLRSALLLLPEHQQQDAKAENGSKNSSQSGSTESGSENSDACRSETPTLSYGAQFTIGFGLGFRDVLGSDACRLSVCVCSGKGQEADKFLSAAPSSPLRKQEVENLR